MKTELIPVLIFLFPFAGALLLPCFYKAKQFCQPIAAALLLSSTYFSILGLRTVKDGSTLQHRLGGWQPPFGIEWRMDSLSAVLCVLVAVICFFVLLAIGKSVQFELKRGIIPFYSTALLNIAGIFGILLTNDFFNLFVFLEVTSLTTYALVATGDRKRGNLASFRYLLIGTAGASFYLLGVGYLYAATGTLNMSDMATRLPEVLETRTVLLGLFLIFMGLAIKMGLFPFHGWLPDAYAYSSNPAACLIAPISTKSSIYVFIRIFYVLLGHETMKTFGFTYLLLALGCVAIFYGAIYALMQKDFKRMLAYSSISHIGLIVLGIGVNSPVAFVGVVLHIIHHAVMKATLFLVASNAYLHHGVKNVFDFASLRDKMPLTLNACLIASLSMIGIPPLCGFFSKWYILVGAVQSEMPWVAIVVGSSSLMTALYFFKLIERGFFTRHKETRTVSETPSLLLVSCKFFTAGIIALGFIAPFIFHWGLKTLALVVS